MSSGFFDLPIIKPLLILDMDETLIGFRHENNTMIPVPRPGLEEFLHYVFKNFDVGIWTAASMNWYEIVKSKIFDKILQKSQNTFCVEIVGEYQIINNKIVKPLTSVYKITDRSPKTTIIVDDNMSTFSQNETNGIRIPPFKAGEKDVFLGELKEILRLYIHHFNRIGEIPPGPHIIPNTRKQSLHSKE